MHIKAQKRIQFETSFWFTKFGNAHKLVKIGRKVGNIGFLQGWVMSPHFYLSSNVDPHVMLGSIFATDIAHLGTIGYPTNTSTMYFTMYDPPGEAYWRHMSARKSQCSSLAMDRECMVCSSLKEKVRPNFSLK